MEFSSQLFRLQKSFGGDERFKLDRTFLDSDDDSTDAEQSGPINVDSQPDEPECDSEGGMDLTKEKEMYLSVLQRVLDKEGHPKSKLNTNAGREFFRYVLQGSTKTVPDSLGLVDFSVGQADFIGQARSKIFIAHLTID